MRFLSISKFVGLVILFIGMMGSTAFANEVGDDSVLLFPVGDIQARYNTLNLDVLDEGLVGDHIDLDSGALSISQMDVSIPGNSNLPVQFGRSLSRSSLRTGMIGSYWAPQIPYISRNYTSRLVTTANESYTQYYGKNSDRCSGELYPPTVEIPINGKATPFRAEAYFNGYDIQVPGRNPGKLVQASYEDTDNNNNIINVIYSAEFSTTDARLVSTENWYVDCIASIPTGGEGYKAHAPNGDIYEFTHLVESHVRDFDLGDSTFPVMAETLYVTKMTDVHDNSVEFVYDGPNLLHIFSNDGREIKFTYNNDGQLATVYVPATLTTPGRSWKYTYVNGILSRVDLPDDTPADASDDQYWTFTSNGNDLAALNADTTREICFKITLPSIEIKHPSGTIVQYDFESIRNGRKDVIFRQEEFYNATAWFDFGSPAALPPESFLDCNDDGDIRSKIPSNFWTIAVTEKRVILPNGPTHTWEREYQEDKGSYDYSGYDITTWAPYNAILDDSKTRTVIDPEGHKTVTYINRAFGRQEGQVVKVEIIPSGETDPIKTTQFTYLPGSYVGRSLGARDHGFTGADSSRVYQTKSIISQDGNTYTTESEFETDAGNANFAYNRPSSIKTNSDVLGSDAIRETLFTYEHKTTEWVLGLSKTISQQADAELREVVAYDYSPKGQKIKQRRYEVEVATLSYNPNGTLAWLNDAFGRRTEAGTWHRGQPQSITKAAHAPTEAITLGQSTDDNGWQISQTDARGNVSTYEHYPQSGRLKKLTPSSTVIGRSPSKIRYDFDGPVFQYVDKGYERQTIKYDDLYRPIEEHTVARHIGLGVNGIPVAPKVSVTTTRYDGLGRVEFKSLPYTTPNYANGTEYTYDALGRPLTAISTITGGEDIEYAYLANNCTKVTDTLNNETTTCKDGYGGPGEGDVVKITQPESIITELKYNGFGELIEVKQSGSVNPKEYFYDDQRRLCRSRTPESKDTRYAYDEAGQLTAYAKGADSSADTCLDFPNEATRVDLTYDALGRLKTTDFADADTPDIWRDYDDDGNLTHLLRGQNSKLYDNYGNNSCLLDAVCWFYEHDEHNRIKVEELQVDGEPFETKSYYNYYGYMFRKVLPTGRQILMANDALGRTLTVGWSEDEHADGFKYHPNGQVSRFNYGNGHVYISNQNDLQQTDRTYIQHPDSGVWALDLKYGYDGNGRIVSQNYNTHAGLGDSNNRTYGYDGAGRLTSASSSSFGLDGAFTYDDMGNLTSKRMQGRTVTNTYNTANRLTKSVESTGGPDGAKSRDVGYDDRGNITTLGGLTFIYDMADQPRTVSGINRKGEAVTGGSYVYDGNLKRVKAVTNGVTRYNVYDLSGKLIHVKESDDPDTQNVDESSETDYLHAAGMVLARIRNDAEDNGVFTYMHPDHLGNASAGTNDDGALVFTEYYTPFGEALNNAPANDNQSDFTGHIRDKDIGMSYMQARYMDPNIGRFLSVDPVSFTGAQGDPRYFGRYSYSGNDPINNTDPTGRQIRCRSCGLMRWGEFKAAGRGLADGGKLAAGAAADLTPGLGDVKGAVEFAQNPSLVGGAAVVAGVVPLVGDVASGALRQSDNVGDVAEILGNAQQTKSAGELTTHGSTSERIANEMAESGEYVSVRMNQTVKTITGGDVSSRVRPDVAGVRSDGTVDAVEVLSPRQTSQQMTDKLENALGSSCGAVTCVAPD